MEIINQYEMQTFYIWVGKEYTEMTDTELYDLAIEITASGTFATLASGVQNYAVQSVLNTIDEFTT